jgi:non-ribosomal peptide synthetase component E (peptide arylation enzyme)
MIAIKNLCNGKIIFCTFISQLKLKIMNNETENIFLQRAALMGVIAAIIENQEERTFDEIKHACINFITDLFEQGISVGDEIEADVINKCKSFFEQQIAVETVKELI